MSIGSSLAIPAAFGGFRSFNATGRDNLFKSSWGRSVLFTPDVAVVPAGKCLIRFKGTGPSSKLSGT